MVGWDAFSHSLDSKGKHVELGRHIKDHRARLGMSQEKLAETIFVSRQTVSNWECDRTYPDVQSLLLLANLFDVSVDELIKGDVEEMKAVITEKAERLNRLGTIMLASGAAAIVWVFATALIDLALPVIVVPFVILFIPCMASAMMADKIKRDNQLYTYRAVDAFMRGEDPDVMSERNQKAGELRWAKVAVKTVIGAVIGFCFGWGVFSILSRLIG